MALEFIAAVEGAALTSMDFVYPSVDPSKYKSYQLRLFGISNQLLDEGPQLTIRFSTDGVNFDEGGTAHNYASELLSWHANSRPAVPVVDDYQQRNDGLFLSLDNALDPHFGTSGVVDILSPGSAGGNALHTFTNGLINFGPGPFAHAHHGVWMGGQGLSIKGIRLQYQIGYQGVQENLSGRAELWGYNPTAGTGTVERAVLRVNRTTNQTLTINAWTRIAFDSVLGDTRGWWNAGTTSYVPQLAGWYRVYGLADINGTFGTPGPFSNVRIRISKNGVSEAERNITSAGTYNPGWADVSQLVHCNGTTDAIAVDAYADMASPIILATLAHMTVTYEGP